MLEIIATTVEDAIAIEQGGGDRIELVSALSEGGLTPSYGMVRHVVNAVRIPVNVMIRPHSNSFVYSETDLRCMIEDIQMVKALEANGVVFGMLDPNGNIAVGQLNRVLEHCQDLEVTFHMAIDEAADILLATGLLASSSICRVLSSGGKERAESGLPVLRQMHDILHPAGKSLLIGSGVNKDNCLAILQATGAHELHVGTAVRNGFSAFQGINLRAVQDTVGAYTNAKRVISGQGR